MRKMERDVMHPFNPIFYHRCVKDIYNSKKINKKDDLYGALNKYHKMKYMKPKYIRKKQRYQYIGVLTSLKTICEFQF